MLGFGCFFKYFKSNRAVIVRSFQSACHVGIVYVAFEGEQMQIVIPRNRMNVLLSEIIVNMRSDQKILKLASYVKGGGIAMLVTYIPRKAQGSISFLAKGGEKSAQLEMGELNVLKAGLYSIFFSRLNNSPEAVDSDRRELHRLRHVDVKFRNVHTVKRKISYFVFSAYLRHLAKLFSINIALFTVLPDAIDAAKGRVERFIFKPQLQRNLLQLRYRFFTAIHTAEEAVKACVFYSCQNFKLASISTEAAERYTRFHQ